jgi:hypothetical protein
MNLLISDIVNWFRFKLLIPIPLAAIFSLLNFNYCWSELLFHFSFRAILIFALLIFEIILFNFHPAILINFSSLKISNFGYLFPLRFIAHIVIVLVITNSNNLDFFIFTISSRNSIRFYLFLQTSISKVDFL